MIYYALVISFIGLLSFLMNSAEMETGVRRNKRVLYGHEANDKFRDTYPVFRYLVPNYDPKNKKRVIFANYTRMSPTTTEDVESVAPMAYYVYLAKAPMGEIDEEPTKITDFRSWIAKFFNHKKGASLDYMECGGSLLTPSIVQTACHCLAIFEEKSNDDNYTYAYPLNVWEDRIYSYIGSNEASKMYDFLIPKHYIIYQNCRVLEFDLDFPMMDVGFIVTKDPVNKRASKAAISYAPVYRAKDILEFYYSSVQKEFMCLVVGHGNWKVGMHPDDFFPLVADDPSELQRWGWRTVMNYLDCLSASYPLAARKRRKNVPFIFFNYTGDSTQACLKAFTASVGSSAPLSPYDYNLGSGDSGGPIACNDVLFAVASMSEESGENIISYVTPIVHAIFMNAVEYRDDLIWWSTEYFINPDLTIYTDPDFPYPLPTYPEFNPTPPPIDFRPLSQCSRITVSYHLIVLSSSLFFTFHYIHKQ